MRKQPDIQRHGETKVTIDERFWAKVRPAPASDCWLWQRCLDYKGYGRFSVEKQSRRAHRWAYEALISEIPKGLILDHLCRTHACVNPWHLEPVTSRVNTLRGDTIAARHAAKTHCIHGHPLSGENVVVDARGWRNCLTCRHFRNTGGRRSA